LKNFKISYIAYYSMVNDRAQGGSCYRDGEIEIMIHRRLIGSDARGVPEPLDEKENNQGLKLRMKHYLVFDKVDGTEDRKVQYILDTVPIVMLANTGLSTFYHTPHEKSMNMMIENCFLKKNIRFTMKDIDDEKFLLRVMNNDAMKTKRFEINHELEELSLSASQNKKEMLFKRLKWNRAKETELTSKENNFQNSEPFIGKILV